LKARLFDGWSIALKSLCAERITSTRGPSGGRIASFKNELKGCGPFLHDEPRDRPREIFAGKTMLHIGPSHAACPLLPIIPALTHRFLELFVLLATCNGWFTSKFEEPFDRLRVNGQGTCRS
jgi:hypothetical protein